MSNRALSIIVFVPTFLLLSTQYVAADDEWVVLRTPCKVIDKIAINGPSTATDTIAVTCTDVTRRQFVYTHAI